MEIKNFIAVVYDLKNSATTDIHKIEIYRLIDSKFELVDNTLTLQMASHRGIDHEIVNHLVLCGLLLKESTGETNGFFTRDLNNQNYSLLVINGVDYSHTTITYNRNPLL